MPTVNKKTIITAIIGIVIIAIIVKQAGFLQVIDVIKQVKIIYLVPAFIVPLAYAGFRALRLSNVLQATHKKVDFQKLYLITMVGLLVDSITPIYKAGSEPIKAFLIGKQFNLKAGEAFGAVVVDRFFDLMLFILLCIVAVFLIFFVATIPTYLLYTLILFLFLLLVFFAFLVYFSVNKRAALRFTNRIFNAFKKIKLLRKKVELMQRKTEREIHIYTLTIKKGFYVALLLNLLISIVIIAFDIIRLQFIVLALGVKVDFVWIVIAMAFLIMSGLIPSPPGGLGVVEPVGILAFMLAGLPLSAATAIVLIERVIWSGYIPILGGISALYLGITKFDKNNHSTFLGTK